MKSLTHMKTHEKELKHLLRQQLLLKTPLQKEKPEKQQLLNML